MNLSNSDQNKVLSRDIAYNQKKVDLNTENVPVQNSSVSTNRVQIDVHLSLSNQIPPRNTIIYENANLHYTKGLNYMKQQCIKLALKEFIKANFILPDISLILTAIAEAYVSLSDFNVAIPYYRRALLVVSKENKAQLLYRFCTILDAWSCYLLNVGSLDKALTLNTEVCKALPENYHYRLHHAIILIKQSNNSHAETMDILFDICSDENTLKVDKLVRTHATSLLVQLLIQNNEFLIAKNVLESALHNNQSYDHTSITLKQSECDFKTRFAEYKTKAIQEHNIHCLSQCVELYPSDAYAHYCRALSYFKTNLLQKAIRDLLIVKELLRNGDYLCEISQSRLEGLSEVLMIKSIRNISMELKKVGRYIEALNYLNEALLWGNTITHFYIYLDTGDCFLHMQRAGLAIQSYNTALISLNKVDEHMFNKDNIYSELIHKSKQKLIEETHFKISSAYHQRGISLFNSGKWKEAENEFTNAIETASGYSIYYYHRAQARMVDPKMTEYAIRDLQTCRNLGIADPKIIKFINQFIPSYSCSGTIKPNVSNSTVKTDLIKTNKIKTRLDMLGEHIEWIRNINFYTDTDDLYNPTHIQKLGNDTIIRKPKHKFKKMFYSHLRVKSTIFNISKSSKIPTKYVEQRKGIDNFITKATKASLPPLKQNKPVFTHKSYYEIGN